MTPAGIETATFRFVAQHLNHCATAVTESTGTVHYKDQSIRDVVYENGYCLLITKLPD